MCRAASRILDQRGANWANWANEKCRGGRSHQNYSSTNASIAVQSARSWGGGGELPPSPPSMQPWCVCVCVCGRGCELTREVQMTSLS